MAYQIIKGPALLRGQAVGNKNIRTKGDIRINRRIESLSISTDDVTDLDRRLTDVIHEVSFTPEGMWLSLEGLLTRPATMYNGEKVLKPAGVNITAVADGTGGKCNLTVNTSVTVYKGQYVTIATSSVAGYVGTWLVDADSAGTTVSVVMAYSETATGTLKVPPCLIIHPINQYAENEGILIYQYAGVTKIPDVTVSTTETLLGETTVSCIYHPYRTAANVESLVRRAAWAAVASTVMDDLDPANILTLAPRMRFAQPSVNEFTVDDPAAAPWKDFRTLAGCKLSFTYNTEADVTDEKGAINWTFGGLSVAATFIPQPATNATDEIHDGTIQELMNQQYSAVASAPGVLRGQSLLPPGDSVPRELAILLDGTSESWIIRIPRMQVTGANAAFGTKAPRNGELTLSSTRKLTSGAPDALFTLES